MRKYSRKKKEIAVEDYVSGIKSGDRTMLARAITLVESHTNRHFTVAQQVIEQLGSVKTNSIRIGITGVPGAGKSTFIDSFGTYLCELGYRVAVLAVDPSSEVSKGSILGDKTRMERLSNNPRAFIRPSPSSGTLGGVNRKTRETIFLCEAAGFDIILIETVGVGQGEFVVRSMVDFFLLLVLTGAGDELQTMKKGIMELPDLVVVNKADGDNVSKAKQAMREYNTILHFLRPYTEGWTTKAVTASALEETGLIEIYKEIEQFIHMTRNNGIFEKRRTEQLKEWFDSSLKDKLYAQFFYDEKMKESLLQYEKLIIDGEKTVGNSVNELISLFLNKKE
ncbi:methylmalonyl Co-A mutase-associated GTPase MeaB [Metabacillus fastidiosus]|uniref:Methylmalonyl Co-A mutase-associated GTPase MeaB n=1 Tax=Metabacillus fastidiosus TaxID=1458 RepID=A0ABU6NWS0_9BACI|nr:methylmalonyl Co-A mutase-associated GTPase MeaB [Metabacillus fastidiosus]